MAGYDPQARRPRPAPPAASPVDGLLDQVDERIDNGEPLVPSEAPVIDLPLDDLAGQKTPESLSLEIEAERKEVQKAISKAVHPSPEDGVSGQVESAAALPGI